MAIAQRLVRKLCPVCKKADKPTPEEAKVITLVAGSIKKKRPDLALKETNRVYRPVGCPACNGTGYKGREGLFEAILMDDKVAQATITNPSEKEIKIAAWDQRILDMRQSGIIKVLHSETSMAEVSRVVNLNAEII